MSGSTQAGKAHVLIQIRDQVSQGLKTMEKKFRDFGTSVSLTSGIALAGSAGLMSWPLKLAGDMEQTTTSFKVFLGDADKAKKLVQTLDDISLTTPYEMSELAESARLMMASGLEDSQIPDMLSMIGDVAQGDAESMYLLSKAFADVAQNGKLMAQENNQFRNSGFNVIGVMAEQMAKKQGGTKEDYMPGLRKQMEEGVISVYDVAEAFKVATSEGGRFHGMQLEQANTFKGLMSTLWDYINRGLRNFGEMMLPTAKMVIRFGQGIADFVGQLILRFSEFFKIVGIGLMVFVALSAVGTAVGGVILALSFVIGVLGSVFATVLTSGFALFITSVLAIGAVIAANAAIIYYFRNEIMNFMRGLYVLFQPVLQSLWSLYETFKMTLGGIMEALTQGQFNEAWNIFLLGLEAGFYELLNLIAFFANMFVDQITAIVPMFGHIIGYTQEMTQGVFNAILAGRLDLAWAIVWNKIAQVWQNGVYILSTAWFALVGFFNIGVAGIKFAFLSVSNFIVTAFEIAFHGIQLAAAEIVRVIATALDAIGQGNIVAGMYGAIKPTETLNELLNRRAAIQEGLVRDVQGEVAGAGIDATLRQAEALREVVRLQEEGERLNAEAAQAQKDGGANTLAERAAKARQELQEAIKAAQRPEIDPQNTNNPFSKAKNFIDQDALMGKYMKSNARGTYSAIAATYLGREANDYEKQTADNTKKTADAVKNLNLTFEA